MPLFATLAARSAARSAPSLRSGRRALTRARPARSISAFTSRPSSRRTYASRLPYLSEQSPSVSSETYRPPTSVVRNPRASCANGAGVSNPRPVSGASMPSSLTRPTWPASSVSPSTTNRTRWCSAPTAAGGPATSVASITTNGTGLLRRGTRTTEQDARPPPNCAMTRNAGRARPGEALDIAVYAEPGGGARRNCRVSQGRWRVSISGPGSAPACRYRRRVSLEPAVAPRTEQMPPMANRPPSQ